MLYQYSLNPIYKEWEKVYKDLVMLLLSTDSIFPNQSLEREIYVEGLFLRFVNLWEHFIEGYLLRCMCTAKTSKGVIIKPIRRYNNIDSAFAVLAHDLKKNRNNYYLDWLSTDFLDNSMKFNFKPNSRVSKNIPHYFPTIAHVSVIRNRIAHPSLKAEIKFSDLVRKNFGYLSSSSSPSTFLLGKYRGTTMSVFQYYMTELNTLSVKLSK